jgi:hypothetical protein
MKDSHFRRWLQEMWYEHCDEILLWSHSKVQYPSSEYFRKYKWWLRAMYRKACQ